MRGRCRDRGDIQPDVRQNRIASLRRVGWICVAFLAQCPRIGSIDLSVSQPGQRGGDRFEVVLVMIAQTKGWFRWRGGRELRSSNEQISTVAVPVASVGFYL